MSEDEKPDVLISPEPPPPEGGGFKSSEFFATLSTLGANLVLLLVTLGIVSAHDKEMVGKSVAALIAALGVAAANAVGLWRYVASREALKVARHDAPPMMNAMLIQRSSGCDLQDQRKE